MAAIPSALRTLRRHMCLKPKLIFVDIKRKINLIVRSEPWKENTRQDHHEKNQKRVSTIYFIKNL